MEISDEYMDSSTINKSKFEDTSKNKKWLTPLFILFTLGQNFLHVTEVELPTLFLLKRSKVTPACAFSYEIVRIAYLHLLEDIFPSLDYMSQAQLLIL